VRNLDGVHNQLGRMPDNGGPGEDVTVRNRTDVASVDFDSNGYRLIQIDTPTGVQTRCSFGENHRYPAMQKTKRLASAIRHRHSE